MKKLEVDKIIGAAKEAFEKPRYKQDVIVDGFMFLICWIPEKGWFEATMLFAPEWGHSHSIYAHSPEELAKKVNATIEDAKQIFTNGGRFTDESHLNENKSKQTITINEAELRKIISESVKKVLKEEGVLDDQDIKQRLYYAIKNSSTHHDLWSIYSANEIFTADLDVPLNIGGVKNCKVIGYVQYGLEKNFFTSKYQEMPITAINQKLVILKLNPSEMEEIIKHIIK